MRRYSVGHLRTLLDIALLLEHGDRISYLASLKQAEIAARLSVLKLDDARQKKSVNRLILHMFRNEIEEFEIQLDSAIMAWGIDITIEQIIVPFLEKVNLVSYTDTSVEAHFAVTDVRRKLILGIEKVRMEKDSGKSALLYLPEGEHYDLLLLYMNYRLRKAGIRVYYLGTNISLNNLEAVLKIKSPDYLYSYVAVKKNFPIKEYAKLLRNNFPHLPLFVAYPSQEYVDPTADKEYIKYCRFNNVCNII